MLGIVKAVHIDFVLRSNHPNANMPKGYWFITEISTPDSVFVWRKTTADRWIRLTPRIAPWEAQSIESDNLINILNRTICASGDEKKRLDGMLKDYMGKNGFDDTPYIYWNR